MTGVYTILLLIVSNIFMTFAWYGHLKLQEMKVISNWPLYGVILFSWFIALAEYSCQQWRTFLALAVESHPRGHHTHHLYGVYHHLFQGRSASLESPGCLLLFGAGRLFCVYEVSVRWGFGERLKMLRCNDALLWKSSLCRGTFAWRAG